jgi:hypothetical protein
MVWLLRNPYAEVLFRILSILSKLIRHNSIVSSISQHQWPLKKNALNLYSPQIQHYPNAYLLSLYRLSRISSNITLDYNSIIKEYQHIFHFCRKAMNKPNIFQTTTSIRSAISFKKDNHGPTLQSKQRSYNLPILNEKATKRNISALIKSLCAEHTARDISILLMECLEEAKFQYMLSHNGFRLAKNIPKGERVTVADIYAFSQALTYCFSFLPPETLVKPLTIVSGVMAPASQDLGSALLKQLWQTQGHTVFDLGTKIKPHDWLDAVDKHQPSFLSISCMLNTCIPNLRELFGLFSAKKDGTRVCVGGMAINKLIALQLVQEYHVPLFYGTDFIGIPKTAKPDYKDQIQRDNTINLPDDITALSSGGNICCYRIPLSEVIIAGSNRRDSKGFLSYFEYAVIVTTSSQPATRRDAKILIRQLMRIEKFFEEASYLAFAFHYPIPCPFCLPSDCRKNENACMNPAYMRPSPKTFHINVSEIMENAKIPDLGLSTLILVKYGKQR